MKHQRLKFIFVTSLTLGRIPLILVFLAVNLFLVRKAETGVGFVLGSPEHHALWFIVAFAGMVLSALTDLFDGYFARRFNIVTKLGEYADPLTDKIFYLVSFPTLVYLACLQGELLHARLLLALTIVFLMRDQWVSFLRSIGALHEVAGKANWSGKARTIVAFPAICIFYWFLMAPDSWWLQLPSALIYLLEVVSLTINLISIWVYTRNYLPVMRQEMRPPPLDE
jgi:CDP-diacylglycerol--glycerol-3-phosphate 3-phosphatidyltransferase